ncbi:T9SS type A sorting domain-containing protein [Bergeyella sp. RCAD1439]|uniref:T9SS type A sorting domain-containing protein n=1 Tax=Bergeyella anatis TaxID=3113737 RepID=UPI002E19B7C5|nr:T9SS type A sorting domain-containing protein [Bergeyella sp. RCAD1439]
MYAAGGNGFGGSSGVVIFTVGPNNHFMVNFDKATDISSIYTVNTNGIGGVITLVPIGGENNETLVHEETDFGHEFTPNWKGVTGFQLLHSNEETFPGLDTIKFTISNLNTQEEAAKKTVTVYPNPVKDLIHINGVEGSNAKAELYDLSGKKLLEAGLKEANNEVNVSSLPKGNYLLKVASDKTNFSQKIIKN